MLIYRILGAVTVALSGAVCAYVLNASAKHAVTQTEGFIALVRYIKNGIECFCLPLPSLFLRCPAEIYSACGYSAVSAPSSARELLEATDISDSQTRSCVSRLFEGLGRGYREEQLALCDNCIEQLEMRRRALCELLPSKKKLNSVICLCVSLALVILLI